MLSTFLQNLTLQEAFETVAQINKEQHRTEFERVFCKKNLISQSIEFLHFFAKRRKMVEKMIHQKKYRGHRPCRIIKYRQSYMSICPIIDYFITQHILQCVTWHVNLFVQKGYPVIRVISLALHTRLILKVLSTANYSVNSTPL